MFVAGGSKQNADRVQNRILTGFLLGFEGFERGKLGGFSGLLLRCATNFLRLIKAAHRKRGATMEAIPQRELRNQSSEILRRVQAGEAFTITNHGKAVAVLRPFDERIGGLEPRIQRGEFNVEDFLVQSINADLLGAVLTNRESKR